jgi:DNA anti-recombination protein RmuC
MPNNNRFHDMEEQLNELRRTIAKDIAERFEASERRVREGLSKDLDTSLEAREQRLRDGLSKDLRQV